MGAGARRRRLPAAAAWALAASAACAGEAPWHVPRGEEARFREAERVCRQLTDGDGGVLHADRFEACMERRDWRRENPIERLF
jgi:hypothetical protein